MQTKLNYLLDELISISQHLLLSKQSEEIIWQKYAACFNQVNEITEKSPTKIVLSNSQTKKIEHWNSIIDQLLLKLQLEKIAAAQELQMIQLTQDYGKTPRTAIIQRIKA